MSGAGGPGGTAHSERKACRSCGAEVVWLKHVRTDKPAPIDEAPNPAGNIVIHLDCGTYENVPAVDREAQRD